MWYQINDIPDVKGHCIYKLFYQEKYVVIACKTIQRSIQNINIGLQYFFKNTPKGRNPNDLYYKFYCYVAENPFHSFRIEILLETTNHFEYLKEDFLSLQDAKLDENCLNMKFEPYVPQYTQSNKHKAWLN